MQLVIQALVAFVGIYCTVTESIQMVPSIPYSPAAALFGPKHNFICNAVVLAKDRVLTTADCLMYTQNGTYVLGRPRDFHVVVGIYNIELFENGKAFAEPARDKFQRKLRKNSEEQYDNHFSNDVFSNRFEEEEMSYLLKGLRANQFDTKLSSNYVSVSNFTIHPQFKGNFTNDLAILEIPDLLDNSTVVQDFNLDATAHYNRTAQVFGWGELSGGINETNRTTFLKMRTIEMYFLPSIICEREVGKFFIPGQHICLKPKTNETLCFGFTGAPIVLEGKLIGIVEFGDARCSLESPVVGFRLGAFDDFLKLRPENFLTRIRNAMRKLFGNTFGTAS